MCCSSEASRPEASTCRGAVLFHPESRVTMSSNFHQLTRALVTTRHRLGRQSQHACCEGEKVSLKTHEQVVSQESTRVLPGNTGGGGLTAWEVLCAAETAEEDFASSWHLAVRDTWGPVFQRLCCASSTEVSTVMVCSPGAGRASRNCTWK